LDGDDDLEILVGSGSNLFVIDMKESGHNEGYWSEFRGNYGRRGTSELGGCMDANNCKYNVLAIWGNGDCATASHHDDNGYDCTYEENNESTWVPACGGAAKPDCLDVCNGGAIIDCNETCNGGAEVDECGQCGGVGPNDGFNCDGTPLSIKDELFPNNYGISMIYPNPFNPITTINYSSPVNGYVRLKVYDINGRFVQNLIDDYQPLGYYSVIWDASAHPSGLYFIIMETDIFREKRKVLLIK